MTRIGRERGWPPATRESFDRSIEPRGALLVGDPREVIEKILFERELFAMIGSSYSSRSAPPITSA